MMPYLSLYIKTALIFTAFDAVWLAKISPEFYKANIGHLLADSPNLVAAVVFYLIFIAGLIYFAVIPSTQSYQWKKAFLRGAFFGFVTYATFDLTSQAVFKDWPTLVTVIDLLWGSILSGLTTTVSARIASRKI